MSRCASLSSRRKVSSSDGCMIGSTSMRNWRYFSPRFLMRSLRSRRESLRMPGSCFAGLLSAAFAAGGAAGLFACASAFVAATATASTMSVVFFMSEPRIYLVNNATTAVHPAVLESLRESLRDVYGNASSIHKEGQTARRRIEDARESVAALIGATAREVVFTSGGTESNNAAIFGAVAGGDRQHIVTTAVEHPSVLEPVAELERRGHAVTVVAQ